MNIRKRSSDSFHTSLPTNNKKFEEPKKDSIRYHDIGHPRDRRTQLDKIAEDDM